MQSVIRQPWTLKHSHIGRLTCPAMTGHLGWVSLVRNECGCERGYSWDWDKQRGEHTSSGRWMKSVGAKKHGQIKRPAVSPIIHRSPQDERKGCTRRTGRTSHCGIGLHPCSRTLTMNSEGCPVLAVCGCSNDGQHQRST